MSKNVKTGKAAGGFLGNRIAGLQKHPAKSLTVDGKVMRKNVLIGKLVAIRRLVDRANALETLRINAVGARDAAWQANAELLHELDPSIRTLVGKDSQALSAFGMAPPKKRAALSPADRLIATARSKHTRDALGTRGKRQRKDLLDQVRGKPQVQVVEPGAEQPPTSTTAANSAPAAAPAPASRSPLPPAANDPVAMDPAAKKSVS